MVKKQTSWTIDEEVIKIVKQDAIDSNRSESWVVNEILKYYYEKEDILNGNIK